MTANVRQAPICAGPNHTEDLSSDKQLWCAVVGQAIDDATTTRTSKQAQRDKQVALEWLLHDTKHFPLICSLAGLDPVAVRERAQRLPGVVEKFQKSPSDRTFPSAQETTKLEFSRP